MLNPKDIPPSVLARSYLEAAAKNGIEATVIYTEDKRGELRTTAVSNKGPEGVARAAAALKIGDGAIERAAIAQHDFRVGGSPCFMCQGEEPWDKIDETDKHGHRELAKIALAAAMAAVATTKLVIV